MNKFTNYRFLFFGLLVIFLFFFLKIPALVFAATSTWTQTDWSGGPGQTSFTDATKFSTSTDIDYSTVGQFAIQAQTNWYNNSWDYRKKITFDNSAQTSNLVNFPVQVALTSSNFDFSKAKTNGEDIRFTDSNGTTLLNYEIEKWDQAGEEAWVWVNVPQVNASSNTDNIYMYYGNPAASDAENPEGTWNSNYALVYHLEQLNTCPTSFLDSTINNNDGSCISFPIFTNLGRIDGARSLDGIDDYIVSADSPDFTRNQLTVSLWANQDSLSTAKSLASKWFYSSEGSWAIQTGNSDNTQLQVFIANALNDPGDNNGITNTGAWSTGWHNVTFTYDSAGSGNSGKLKIYVDGAAQTLTFNGTIPSSLQDSSSNLRMGDFGNLNRNWNGRMDEVRISTIAQTPDWIAASYKSENNTFNTFGSEEGLYPSTASITSSILDTTQNTTFGSVTYSVTNPTNTSTAVKVRTSNSASMVGAPAFGTCTAISSGSDMSANACVTDTDRYIQYQVILANTDSASTPAFTSISLQYETADSTPTPSSGASGTSNSTSGSSTPPSCTTQVPSGVPIIYQIKSNANSSTLYFTPTGSNTTGYTISYGTSNSADQYTATFNSSDTSGAISFSVNDLSYNTIWYFKVRSQNGCAPGNYSPIMSSSTTYLSHPNIIQKLFNQQSISTVEEIRKIATPNLPSETIKKENLCEYAVQKGDSLWSISRKYLGEGTRYAEIVELNIKEYPFIEDMLPLENVLKLPCETEQSRGKISSESKIVKAQELSQTAEYDLTIKLSADGKPLGGAMVEIHSKVQKTIASSEGVATFKKVEPGEHTVKIAYKSYTGEHKIALTGDEKDIDIDLSIKLVQTGFASHSVQGVIVILILVILGLVVYVFRKKLPFLQLI